MTFLGKTLTSSTLYRKINFNICHYKMFKNRYGDHPGQGQYYPVNLYPKATKSSLLPPSVSAKLWKKRNVYSKPPRSFLDLGYVIPKIAPSFVQVHGAGRATKKTGGLKMANFPADLYRKNTRWNGQLLM